MSLFAFIRSSIVGHRGAVLLTTVASLLSALCELVGIAWLVPIGISLFSHRSLEDLPLAQGMATHSGIWKYILATPLPLALLGVIFAILARSALVCYSQTILGRMGAVVEAQIATRLLSALTQARWGFHLEQSTNTLVNALTTQARSAGYAVTLLPHFLTAAIMAGSFLLVALICAPLVIICGVIVGSIIVLLMRLITRPTSKVAGKLVTANRDRDAIAIETLQQYKYLLASGTASGALVRYAEPTKRFVELNNQGAFLQSLAHVVPETLVVVAVCIVIAVAKWQPWYSPPAIAFALMAFYRAMIYLQATQRSRNTLHQFISAYELCQKLGNLAEAALEAPIGTGHTMPTISFNKQLIVSNIKVSFPNSSFTLRVDKLEIDPNESIALVGHSGAGKTTLADLILGLIPPSQGSISVDGQVLDLAAIGAWRAVVSYIPQDPVVFTGTIRDNLTRDLPGVTQADIDEIARCCCLEDFISDRTGGVDAFIGERGSQLSGGQKQRLALARALLRRPKLIILDEATSALDSIAEGHIYKTLSSLKGKVTMIIIAHRLATVRMCDRVAVLDRGVLVETGNFETIRDTPGSQLGKLCAAQVL